MSPRGCLAVLFAVLLAAPALGAANPASVYCESRGGHVEIETAKDGRQSDTCVFPDGTRVNEWAYFRSTHRVTR